MKKIFIVEDEDIIRRGLVCTIDWLRLGCSVVGDAPDGLAALPRIEALQPDIVLTDIRMPRLDGLALAQRLKECAHAPAIIFLTSYADFSYAQAALRLQAADYLLKPIDEAELQRVLEKIPVLPPRQPDEDDTGESTHALKNWAALRERLQQAESPYIRAVLAAIQTRYREKLSLEQIAAEQGVSQSYLSRKLKDATGQTFGSLLARYRLQQSIDLLAAGTWRVYEIAEQTGFGDYKNFCQVFKKYLHTSPRAFLRQAAGGIRLEGDRHEPL